MATTCSLTGLKNGRTYVVKVEAFNAYGSSAYSTPLSVTVGGPGAPTNVTLTWNGVPGDEVLRGGLRRPSCRSDR